MNRKILFPLIVLIALLGSSVYASGSKAACKKDSRNWEVWALDQAPSVNPKNSSEQLSYGGSIYILSQDQAMGKKNCTPTPYFIDLALETTDLCINKTGSTPVVPHLIWFNRDMTHASVSFLGTGHVVIFQAKTRKPVACLLMPQNPSTNRSGVHAVIPTYDEKYFLVANSFGKAAHKISTDFKNNKFELVDTIDVVSCTTLSGLPCEASGIRPNNIVPCVFELEQSISNRLAFISLVGGGGFVIDYKATPMKIIAEYDQNHYYGATCWAFPYYNNTFINMAFRPYIPSTGFSWYKFNATAYLTGESGVDKPLVTKVMDYNDTKSDIHAISQVSDNLVWVADRAIPSFKVVDVNKWQIVNEIFLNDTSVDPQIRRTVDWTEITPDCEYIVGSLRGPITIKGDPMFTPGGLPGVMVLKIEDGGLNGKVENVYPLHKYIAGTDYMDIHGLVLRKF